MRNRAIGLIAALGIALSVGASVLAVLPSAAVASDVQSRVIGGTLAPLPDAPGGWPYQTALLDSSEPDPYFAQFCGGTLIAPSWILTAAHCVTAGFVTGPSSLNVALGIRDLTTITSAQRIAVERIVVRAGWDSVSKQNDYALLLLKSPSTQPVAQLIAPGEETATEAGDNGEVAGWGTTVAGDPSSAPANLRNATVPFVSDADCAAAYPTSRVVYFDAASMICAGSATKDTCQGDSGGPLMAYASALRPRVLAGITSWGDGCAVVGKPGVYARVLPALSWIQSTTSKFPLNVRAGGEGSGAVSSSPSGISCGSDCTQDYADGTNVTLTAAAASGSQFTGWSGAGCSGTGTCSVTMSQVRDVTATFAALPAPEPTPTPAPEPTPTPAPTPTPDNTFVLSDRSVSVSKASIRISSKATILGAGKLQQIGKARATNNKGRVHWCSTTVQLSGAGTWSLRCPYGPTARRELKRKSLRVELKTTFWPTSGLPQTTQQQQFTLKRRR